MRIGIRTALLALTLIVSSSSVLAAPAMQVLGKDFAFPNTLEGLPAKLSDFKAL